MSENIELHSFSLNTTTNSEIEEYHEIINPDKSQDVQSHIFSSPVKDYDFFTKYDVRPAHKPRKKKKIKEKKLNESNLMDIVNTELASVAVPITEESVITTVDSEEHARNYGYLVRTPSVRSLFSRLKPFRLYSGHGWELKQNPVNLSPIFPRVLENAVVEDYSIPVQYVDPVSFEDLKLQLVNEDKETDKFLDITIENIRFLHHHSFSLETMICAKLIESFDRYNSSLKEFNDLTNEIRAVRQTRHNLKQEFLKISPSKKEDIRFDRTLRKYTNKQIELKEQHQHVLKMQRKMLHNVISLWSDIEMIREKFDHIETPYHLDIVCKELDQKQFEQEWADAFNIEFNDMLDKIEYEYVTDYIEYKELKNHQNKEDLENKKVTKPKLLIDEEALKKEVEEIVNNMVTTEKIEVYLKKDERRPSSALLKFDYQFEIYVDKVFVCKSETYTFKSDFTFDVEFTESFSVQILPRNETLTVLLLEDKEEVSSIVIDLYKIRQNSSIAEFSVRKFIYSNLLIQPNQNHVGTGHSIKDVAKSTKVRLKSSNIFEGTLQTACDINLKMGWNENLSQNQSEMIKQSMNIGRQLKRLLHGIDKLSIDGMQNIIGKIYGRDVGNNENVIQTLHNVCKMKLRTDYEFPINEDDAEFVRIKLLHLRNNGGFSNVENKLVPLYASQISTDQLNCLQGSGEKDIDIEYISDKYAQSDPIELQRFIGCKYVQKLNQNMLKNLHDHLMKKTHKDVVRDYQELSLRSFFSSQPSIATISAMPRITKQQYLKSSLNHEQEVQVTVLRAFNLMDRTSIILSEDNDDDDSTIAGFKVHPLRPFVKISYRGVSANTATAIGCHPTWNQTIKIKTKLQPLSSLHINIFDEYKVNLNEGNSDDEARGKTVHFRCCNRWLGTVQVPIHTVLTMGSFRGTFKITTPPVIFGYEILQNKDSSQSLIPEVTQLLRKETSFISLNITTSLSHFGGSQGYNQPIPNATEDNTLIKHLNSVVTDYINDFPSRNISLTFIDCAGKNKCVTQFLQPIPMPSYECFPKNPKTSRAESALSKSSGFSKSSSSRSSSGRKRDKDEEKTPESHKSREESLYSGHEGSWRGESQVVKMMNAALRYVALIPTYEVTESHVVTLMGVELLKVLYGSPLDHTILLASYFLQLGVKCWVVIGQGLPRGQSSFVLTKYDLATHRDVLVTDQLFRNGGFLNKGDGYLWNVYDATSGERFELRDVSCPLKTVDYVFDNENIWLNIQSTQDCTGVSFDLTKSSNWLPVFDRSIFVMKNPLVSDPGLYSPPVDVTALRDALEAKIKLKVQKWRPQLKTIWNRYCSSLLREMLPQWEYWTFNQSEPKPVFSQKLKQLMISYKLFGFPLNMPFVSCASVCRAVKATRAHAQARAEFALAAHVHAYPAHVHAYPAHVLSVWVCLLSVTRL